MVESAYGKLDPCTECAAIVVKCDNFVWLDWPSVPYDPYSAIWGLMPVGGMLLAAGGGPDRLMGHTLHEHQPPEAV